MTDYNLHNKCNMWYNKCISLPVSEEQKVTFLRGFYRCFLCLVGKSMALLIVAKKEQTSLFAYKLKYFSYFVNCSTLSSYHFKYLWHWSNTLWEIDDKYRQNYSKCNHEDNNTEEMTWKPIKTFTENIEDFIFSCSVKQQLIKNVVFSLVRVQIL